MVNVVLAIKRESPVNLSALYLEMMVKNSLSSLKLHAARTLPTLLIN